MTEGELRTLISNDVEAQALVAFAGESLTISTRTEALRAGDPLTTFKKLLRRGRAPSGSLFIALTASRTRRPTSESRNWTRLSPTAD